MLRLAPLRRSLAANGRIRALGTTSILRTNSSAARSRVPSFSLETAQNPSPHTATGGYKGGINRIRTNHHEARLLSTRVNPGVGFRTPATTMMRNRKLYPQIPCLRREQLHPCQVAAIRWKSSDGKNDKNGSEVESKNRVSPSKTKDGRPGSESSPTSIQKQEAGSSNPTTRAAPETATGSETDAVVANTPIAEQLQRRVIRVVEELNMGDQLAVILIATLTALLVAAPYAIRQMKQSDTVDYSITSEDPIDDLTAAWNEDYQDSGSDGESGGSSRKSAVETVLQDIMKSQGLQHAAQQFVIQILESPEFQAALQRLVKRLWSDLVSDPETVAQVIRLLQIALQDPAIQKAAQELVIELVQEPEVKQALVAMVQDLGKEPPVLEATQSLLSEATHNALNDPEILEHSMEFATDVVGDELVQQQAGEALWNSVGHAVRPATSIFLTAAGVGLLIFSIVAIGYARSSDQEVVLFETAARSLQTNATYGIMRILSWPVRVLQRILVDIRTVLWTMPMDLLRGGSSYVARHVYEMLACVCNFVVSLPGRLAHAASKGIVSTAQSVGRSVSSSLRDAGLYAKSSVVSLVAATVSSLLDMLRHVLDQALVASNKAVETSTSRLARASSAVSKKGSRALDAADQKILDLYFRLVAAMQELWKHVQQTTHFRR